MPMNIVTQILFPISHFLANTIIRSIFKRFDMSKVFVILLSLAIFSGCSTHTTPVANSTADKNGWMLKGNFIFGNELFYCQANDNGGKAEPNCYSAKYFYRR
jgi:hypothetical protein